MNFIDHINGLMQKRCKSNALGMELYLVHLAIDMYYGLQFYYEG